MTPAARVSAAIEVLDRYLAGAPLEKALTNWGRQNRYAGSKDRAAVRDHVFSACRQLRSAAAKGGSRTGRGLMIGLLSDDRPMLDQVFSGDRFAPATLSEEELAVLDSQKALAGDEAVDCPEWLWPAAKQELGEKVDAVFAAQQTRAPVFLRVNLAKTDVAAAERSLSDEGIETTRHPRQASALKVVSNARRVQKSKAFVEGLVELQDASSQAIADFAPIEPGQRVLDLCAGGGGKSLAMAARVQASYFAHDIDPRRLAPLNERVVRAGASITSLVSAALHKHAPFDGVLCDVPCSGSGSWRRSPEGKWALTPARLSELKSLQAQILDQAVTLVSPGGWITYATCSILSCENEEQVRAFLSRHSDWRLEQTLQFFPDADGDGLFSARFFHAS